MKEQKQKKKFNKKLLMFGVFGLFALALVSAIAYYALFSVSFTINQPIRTSGDLTQTIDCITEHTCFGTEIVVSNDGTDGEKTIIISNDNVNGDITISYIGELTLSHKDLTTWIPYGDLQTITYTIVGDTFEASGVPVGYSLVYYKDNAGYVYTGEVVTAITMNLPFVNDENTVDDNVLDYCNNGFNPSATQCVGAKLWLVPTDAITSNVINWGRANEFYFETSLIQFNAEGSIIISPESSVTFKPQFEVDEHASDWSGTITTTIA